jgi:hypothetical protein
VTAAAGGLSNSTQMHARSCVCEACSPHLCFRVYKNIEKKATCVRARSPHPHPRTCHVTEPCCSESQNLSHATRRTCSTRLRGQAGWAVWVGGWVVYICGHWAATASRRPPQEDLGGATAQAGRRQAVSSTLSRPLLQHPRHLQLSVRNWGCEVVRGRCRSTVSNTACSPVFFF